MHLIEEDLLTTQHLKYFTSCGISEETLIIAEVESIPLDQAEKELGFKLSREVQSVCKFPYYETDFARYLVFHSATKGYKKEWFHKRKAVPRLYIPNDGKLDFHDITIPLLIADNEIDALALFDDAQFCVCIPGLWSPCFYKKSLVHLMRDFSAIPLKCRPIILMPNHTWGKNWLNSANMEGRIPPAHYLSEWLDKMNDEYHPNDPLSDDKTQQFLFALGLCRVCRGM